MRTFVPFTTAFWVFKLAVVEGIVQYYEYLANGDWFAGFIGKAYLVEPVFDTPAAPALGSMLKYLRNGV